MERRPVTDMRQIGTISPDNVGQKDTILPARVYRPRPTLEWAWRNRERAEQACRVGRHRSPGGDGWRQLILS